MLTPAQEKLVYWIHHREEVRKAKEASCAKPWSPDPIFQNTYFTNVNREDDKVTKWIRENITYPHNFLMEECSRYYDLALISARIFNYIPVLEELQQPVETHNWLEHIEEVLRARKLKGEKVWGSAYMITTHGKQIDKITYYLEMFKRISKQPLITAHCNTLKEAHSALMRIEGLSSFLCAQVVADLKNTPEHHLAQAEDWWEFSSHGAGSLRGLSWFWGEKVVPTTYKKKITEAYELLQFELNRDIIKILCMQNLQNCFCEFDKYMRILNNTGKTKRKDSGEAE
jgi:hypothetical protein